MALTQGITGSGQATDGAGEELAFDASINKASTNAFMVRCRTASLNPARVRVLPIHHGVAAGAGVVIEEGDVEHFSGGQIHQVLIGGSGGAATVDWGPVGDGAVDWVADGVL